MDSNTAYGKETRWLNSDARVNSMFTPIWRTNAKRKKTRLIAKRPSI